MSRTSWQRASGRGRTPAALRRLVLLAGVLALALTGTASPALADIDDAVRALSAGPGVYVDDAAVGNPISAADLRRIESQVEGSDTPIFLAVLPETAEVNARAAVTQLGNGVRRAGVYAVATPVGFFARSTDPDVPADVLATRALQEHPGDPGAAVSSWVAAVSDADSRRSNVGTRPRSTSTGGGGGGGGLLAVLGLLVVAGGGALLWSRRKRAKREAAELAEVRSVAEEDVTALGEDIAGLDIGRAADEATTQDYRGALDAYDRSKAALEAARSPDDLSAVTEHLEEGRWRMECVRARLAGRPVPERRPPCFFNPRHGPSVTEVEWSPDGGAPRPVPVCALDAERLARGEEPDSRTVLVGGAPTPYWMAPAAYSPYAGGFYGGWGGGGFLSGLVLGSVLTGPGMGFGLPYGGGYESGYVEGYDDAADRYDDRDGGGGWGGGDVGGGSWGGGGGDGWGGDVGGGGWGGGGDVGGGGWDGGGDVGGGGWGDDR
ncbi:hypothetical protein [Motilibacter deserti]|uniref:TLP18.3/Psb32/MOLO-1 phosphatase superfamily protein n=1 Tax=Motilibacter deserti TaxID=2714956 RepID=A0ABX0GVS9_9ACTN|nr:hypothetical protein [Motilibacter deserti]NHC14618.1 hypothetical protein [Motilibacter deserti]